MEFEHRKLTGPTGWLEHQPLHALLLFALMLTCTSNDGSSLQVLAISGGSSMQGLEGLFVEVQQGNGIRRLTATDFRVTDENQTPHTDPISLDDAEPIGVTAGLLSGADTLAVLSADLIRRRGFNWFITVGRSTSNPNTGCFNCLGQDSVTILGTVGERFWLQWGGSEQGIGPY